MGAMGVVPIGAPTSSACAGEAAPTIAVSILRTLLGHAALGSDVETRLLRDAGIDVPLPRARAARLDGERFARFWRLLAQRLDDEMPNLLARPARSGATKLLCLGLIEAPTLNIALHRLRRFAHVMRDDFSIHLSVQDGSARFVLQPEAQAGAGSPFGQLMLLKMFHGLASWLVAQRIPLREVSFAFAPQAPVEDCLALFPGPARFGQAATAFAFDATLLELPLRRSRTELRRFLARVPHDWLFFRDEASLAERVRVQLDAAIRRSPGIEEIARALHLSVRTLTRRLEAEGTSFQAIKDGARRDAAIDWLIGTDAPVSAIGEALGFGDPASFFRAFRKWTGVTPAVFRSRPPAPDRRAPDAPPLRDAPEPGRPEHGRDVERAPV